MFLKDLPSCVLKTSKQEILQPLWAACSLLSQWQLFPYVQLKFLLLQLVFTASCLFTVGFGWDLAPCSVALSWGSVTLVTPLLSLLQAKLTKLPQKLCVPAPDCPALAPHLTPTVLRHPKPAAVLQMQSQKCQIEGKDQLSVLLALQPDVLLSQGRSITSQPWAYISNIFGQFTLIVCCLYGNQESSVIIYISFISILPYFFFQRTLTVVTFLQEYFAGSSFPIQSNVMRSRRDCNMLTF